MEAAEASEDAGRKLREDLTDPDQLKLLDEITASSNKVFEACSFQDITGQRVNKIAKSIIYVEDRVNMLIDLFGEDEMAEIEVELRPDEEKTDDEKLLSGPQNEGEGLSQDDIDNLFD
jgi:chemotaxis protein CheZ